jgi:hypothetical protein
MDADEFRALARSGCAAGNIGGTFWSAGSRRVTARVDCSGLCVFCTRGRLRPVGAGLEQRYYVLESDGYDQGNGAGPAQILDYPEPAHFTTLAPVVRCRKLTMTRAGKFAPRKMAPATQADENRKYYFRVESSRRSRAVQEKNKILSWEDTREIIHAHDGSRTYRDVDRFCCRHSGICCEPGPDVLSGCRFLRWQGVLQLSRQDPEA